MARFLWTGTFLLAFVAAGGLEAQQADLPTTALQGPWKQMDGGSLCYIHRDQVFTFDQGKLRVLGIVHHRPGGVLILRNEGKLEAWRASREGRRLRFGKGSDVRIYRKLRTVPPQVTLKPFPLGDPRPLPAERVKAIQDEILARTARDQEVRKDPAKKALALSVDADNKRYFFNLLREVGWLDAARFGTRTSVYAAVFIKHFQDLSLNLAALPFVERDLKTTGEGQIYAIVYDDTQLHLGRKQRYGTQISEDAQGNPYVLPLEQPERVDALLKEIGQAPLANYLADVSKFLYDGKPVRMATLEESE